MRGGSDWLLNVIPSRLATRAEGLDGGGAGAPGRFEVNGSPVVDTRKMDMKPDDEVLMVTPGGGGYGKAE